MESIQESNKQLARDVIQAVQNDRDLEAIDRYFSPEFVFTDAPDGFPANREGDKQLHRLLFSAFPDIKVEILDIAAEGDKVWVYKRFEGTHNGAWMDIPPTGQKITINVINIMTYQDGLVTDVRMVADFAYVLSQLAKAAGLDQK